MEINDNQLRPLFLDDFIGQDEVKYKLKVYIECALKRNECLDHVLFYGPSGVGKTTLANIVANQMHSHIKILNGATIEKPSEIISSLILLKPGDILFIDEIHRLPLFIQEILYSAMEDFFIEVSNSSCDSSTHIHIDIAPFTLIGATTCYGSLAGPLRNRFGIIERLSTYSLDDMVKMVTRLNKIYNLEINEKGIKNIACRTRGVPRTLVMIYKRIRDFHLFNNPKSKEVSSNEIDEYFKLLHIDKKGLNEIDYKYLKTLYFHANGDPIGLELISYSLNESVKTIEDFIEPYLLQIGFIQRGKKGRQLTNKSKEYLVKNNIV